MTTNQAQMQTVEVPWWLVLLQGISALIIGLSLLIAPGATTLFVVQFLGIYWLISGIFQIVGIFVDDTSWGWKLFGGVIGILAGFAVLNHPLWSTFMVPNVLATMIGVFGIISGIVSLMQAFQGAGWGVGVLGGLSILFGMLLLAHPIAATLSLPWVFGIFGVFGGTMSIFAAFKLK
ncbi:MAG TPA: HdeD family acid-resistance protein [Anaerolineales bacterium]|nr:HdeD family acid-resistance protein [Anaerolineales bacterium]